MFLPLAMDAGAGVGDDERRAAPHPAVPELRAAAAALVRMVAAAAPEGFRRAVAALGSESRSRLQSALAGGGDRDDAGGCGGTGDAAGDISRIDGLASGGHLSVAVATAAPAKSNRGLKFRIRRQPHRQPRSSGGLRQPLENY